ncbi:MAG: glycosyltransferase family 2 protein [Pseudomonadota bacterium]
MSIAETGLPLDQPSDANRVEGQQVLVAIPTLNEAAHIETCIRSLMVGDERLANVKIVVADGGSTDATRQIVEELSDEFPNVVLIDNPKKLQSAAVNLVAKHQSTASHTILVRCDAHAAYPPAYIMRIADNLAKRNTASLVVCMDAVGDDTCFQKANAWVVDTPIGSGGSAHRAGARSGLVDHGHHAGFVLDLFNEIGGYDESFSHNEDAELDQRLIAAGGEIWLDASIRIDYHPRSDVRSLAKQYYNYGRGRARTLIKHRKRPKLRQLAPVALFAGSVLGLALSVITPWSLILPLAYICLLALVSIWGVLATKSTCGALAGIAAGTMHMTWAAGFLRQLTYR